MSRVSLGIYFICLFSSISLKAGDIQFFDPSSEYKKDSFYGNFQLFLANDPISLYQFFHGWKRDYSPKNGSNIAVLDSRIDLGSSFGNDYYLGYFYRYNVFLDASRDLSDLFYNTKNKNNLISQKKYDLELKIEGIRQNGLVIAKSIRLYDDTRFVLDFGASLSLSYSIDMQNGYLSGRGRVVGKKDYDIEAKSSYFYTKNYLYDLDVDNASGYGYGVDIGFNFEDTKSRVKFKLLFNDILNSIYWKDLPYSQVVLKTENKSYDENGYAKYEPSISGVEKYVDYTQKLSSRTKLQMGYSQNSRVFYAGIDYVYNEVFPYIMFDQKIDEENSIELYYGGRFENFGIGYIGSLFKAGFIIDNITAPSAFGVNSSFVYRF